jgi:hypothetical protein
MPLTSDLFRGNLQLQACAREDAAHVLLGAAGEHVAKIQHALFEIDGLRIDRAELVSQRYGRSTAAAVLAYKKKRQIINRSYQTVADDIVGKMTIASLDKEMKLRELVPKTPSECRQGGGSAPQAPSLLASNSLSLSLRGSSGAQAAGPNAGRNIQLGGVARINVTVASNANSDGFPLASEIERARDSLFEHGVALAVERHLSGNGVVQFVERVIINPDSAADNVNELRKRCEDLLPGQPGILRVIVCRLGNFDFGHTLRNRKVGNQLFPPFVLLNTEQVDQSRATLIHEMIHASKRGPVPHDREPFSVFSENGSSRPGAVDRTFLKPEHAATIASSFFSVGGPR